MRYAEIDKCEIRNGLGIGVSIWCTLCPIRCEFCCNKEIWDKDSGQPFTDQTLEQLIGYASKPWIDRISILGGEPLCEDNARDVRDLLDTLRHHRDTKDKKIWIYTGYTINNLCSDAKLALQYADVLVDGPYIEAQRDLTLAFRGSRNQRIIDLKTTTDYNNPVLLDL